MLWRCLKKKSASLKLTRSLQNYYGLAKNFVKFNREKSNTYELQKSVRHGDPCSGPLFNLYLDGLVDALCKGKRTTIKIGETPIFEILYADDVVLRADSEQQRKSFWTQQWNYHEAELTVNVNKSKAMVIKGNRRERFEVKIHIGKVALQHVSMFWYSFQRKAKPWLNSPVQSLADSKKAIFARLTKSTIWDRTFYSEL